MIFLWTLRMFIEGFSMFVLKDGMRIDGEAIIPVQGSRLKVPLVNAMLRYSLNEDILNR